MHVLLPFGQSASFLIAASYGGVGGGGWDDTTKGVIKGTQA
jgi:hypothetical protein